MPHHFTCDKIGPQNFEKYELVFLRIRPVLGLVPVTCIKIDVSCILQIFKNTNVLSIEFVFEVVKYITVCKSNG